MRQMRSYIVLGAIISLVSASWAQGKVEKASAAKQGIRIGIRNAPGVDEFERDAVGGGTTTTSIDPEDGVQLDVLYVRRYLGNDGKNTVGPMWGAGIFLSNSSGSVGGTEFEQTAFGFMGEGGLAVQLGEIAVLEAMPFFGIGGASQEMTGFTSGGGPYLMYGVKGGIFFQLGDNVELGLEAGYSGFTSMGEIETFGGTTYDFYFSGGGFQGGGGFVIKF